MSARATSRPGGRSARVQQSVHQAVRELEAEVGRDALTVPLIAARAGVTPSTVYRRWGDLRELLSDVAVERLRPDGPPADHGSLRADLAAWAVQFAEEMDSTAGRTYVRDALLGDPEQGNAVRCSDYAAEQLTAIGVRAAGRGEAVPGVEALLDVVVAPLMYRILFRPSELSEAYTDRLVAAALGLEAKS
ncbi:TetR/AcrR family transcriptional regulator [Kitasatospora viridis]|uniref:TetR family transcriptional regulator n=1 Tax=Kitasatospora viridis TaxID=281105 RepID=A0A561TW44_9ACTN|nr:TetR/AcrR family transcriptional regulator [Kitasatospora viridis]TWF91330.1 TetR family transcriptional regulator [Kitasatospora viridis]